jgi:hypothetical protein
MNISYVSFNEVISRVIRPFLDKFVLIRRKVSNIVLSNFLSLAFHLLFFLLQNPSKPQERSYKQLNYAIAIVIF